MGRRLVGLESVDGLVSRAIDRESISGCHVRCRCVPEIVLGAGYDGECEVKVRARVMQFAPPRRLSSIRQTFGSFVVAHISFVQ